MAQQGLKRWSNQPIHLDESLTRESQYFKRSYSQQLYFVGRDGNVDM